MSRFLLKMLNNTNNNNQPTTTTTNSETKQSFIGIDISGVFIVSNFRICSNTLTDSNETKTIGCRSCPWFDTIEVEPSEMSVFDQAVNMCLCPVTVRLNFAFAYRTPSFQLSSKRLSFGSFISFLPINASNGFSSQLASFHVVVVVDFYFILQRMLGFFEFASLIRIHPCELNHGSFSQGTCATCCQITLAIITLRNQRL